MQPLLSPKGKKTKGEGASVQLLEELFRVEGVDDEIYFGKDDEPGLKDLLTTFTDGKIYINTASEAVLQLIPGVDTQVAKEIASMLQAKKVFKKVTDLK